jgi:hypothetical protein
VRTDITSLTAHVGQGPSADSHRLLWACA